MSITQLLRRHLQAQPTLESREHRVVPIWTGTIEPWSISTTKFKGKHYHANKVPQSKCANMGDYEPKSDLWNPSSNRCTVDFLSLTLGDIAKDILPVHSQCSIVCEKGPEHPSIKKTLYPSTFLIIIIIKVLIILLNTYNIMLSTLKI